uniref:Uncharacterized protein n=1 Tax=Avena sativa TaxID=4498 RepID=A0ACD5ZT27_AVESA
MANGDVSGGQACAFCACLVVAFVLVILLCALLPVSVKMLAHRVENGTLHTMHFDKATSTLTYNISALFSFRNRGTYPLKEVRVGKIAAALFYGGQKLEAADGNLATFEVQPWETAMVPLDVRGRQITGDVMARTGEEDAARGYYTVEVEVHLRTVDHRWCDSSCIISFLAPTSLKGGPCMFDGEDCKIKCKKRGV